jgi:hypothetical protein
MLPGATDMAAPRGRIGVTEVSYSCVSLRPELCLQVWE